MKHTGARTTLLSTEKTIRGPNKCQEMLQQTKLICFHVVLISSTVQNLNMFSLPVSFIEVKLFIFTVMKNLDLTWRLFND